MHVRKTKKNKFDLDMVAQASTWEGEAEGQRDHLTCSDSAWTTQCDPVKKNTFITNFIFTEVAKN